MSENISNREQKLFENLSPVVEPFEVELLDVEIKTHGERPIIRLVVDTKEGIDLGRCEEISDYVAPLIDLEIPDFDESYDLEISSPGLERTLRRSEELDRFAGRQVIINCYAPYEGTKEWRGELVGQGKTGVLLDVDGEKLEIPHDIVASVKLYFDAEEALKKREE